MAVRKYGLPDAAKPSEFPVFSSIVILARPLNFGSICMVGRGEDKRGRSLDKTENALL